MMKGPYYKALNPRTNANLFCANPCAIKFFEQNPDFLNDEKLFKGLCKNPVAEKFIDEKLAQIQAISTKHLLFQVPISSLIMNPAGINLILKYYKDFPEVYRHGYHLLCNHMAMNLIKEAMTFWKNNIFWSELCKNSNPEAIAILKENLDKINWAILSANPAAISILEEHLDKIDYNMLATNPAAMHIILENLDKITNIDLLSRNPSAIPFLEKNPHLINWSWLSLNPSAMHLLLRNQDKINYYFLSANPSALDLLAQFDYVRMRTENKLFREEIESFCFI